MWFNFMENFFRSRIRRLIDMQFHFFPLFAKSLNPCAGYFILQKYMTLDSCILDLDSSWA